MKRHATMSSTAPTQATGTRRAAFGLTCLCILGLSAFLGSAVPAAGAAETCANEARRVEQSSTALPECRAWEMVSPPDKNGADVMAETTHTRAAADGDAVGFMSLGGFGDTLGTGIAAEYMARRTGVAGTNGWSTHGLLPKLDPNSYNSASQSMDSLYQGEFSDDFSKGILRTFTNLTGDPNLANVTGLYLREDLMTPGSGSYELLTACPICAAPLKFSTTGPNPTVVGTTPDFGHILFEARYNYTADAPAQPPGCINTGLACRPRLYEWDHGTLRLVGILPDSEGGEAVQFSVAGVGPSGSRYTLGTISEDGSRIIWTRTENGGGSTGPLYMREDGTSSIRLSASERTDCASDPTCGGDGIPDPSPDPAGEQPARYEHASADGSRVFFRTTERLTDDDDNDNADLYVYDAALPATDPHNLTRVSIDGEPDDASGDVNSVIGASEDGSYVYFTNTSQLVDGGPAITSAAGLYIWHAGTLAYIGGLPVDDLTLNAQNSQLTVALWSRVTPDGRHLLFTSRSGAALTGYDHNTTGCGDIGTTPCSELYLYEATDDALICATCNQATAKAISDAGFTRGTGKGGIGLGPHLSHPLSVDGSRVFFTTGERLVPEDRNGAKLDAYVYDAETGEQHLLSSGRSSDDSYFMDASPDGDDAFFVTRERLSGWDVDNSADLYDARVGGGFPEPPAAAPACDGEACQGSPQANPPTALSPTSARFHGPGNAKARARQKKAKHGKRKHKTHRSGKRAAGHNRGGNR